MQIDDNNDSQQAVTTADIEREQHSLINNGIMAQHGYQLATYEIAKRVAFGSICDLG